MKKTPPPRRYQQRNVSSHSKPRRCMFCVRQERFIDYKNIRKVAKHLSNFSRILPRRHTGTCVHHQKMVAQAIKQARFMALMPYTMDHRQTQKQGV